MPKAGGGGTTLDAALDELYRASPAEFTAKRDALAKALKRDADAAGAADLKGRRKPTQLAYVLNQLARRHADDVAELVDVGRELARAQRKALRGEAGRDLRDAITRQRGVVSGLTTKTAALMGELGVPMSGHLDEIASALQAALVDPAVGALLEEGRLEKVPAPAAGFPGATPQEVDVTPMPVRERAEARADAKEHAKGTCARTAREEDARSEATRREAEHARRKNAAIEARADAEERGRTADQAEREADGLVAQAKKLDGEARALAVEAKRLALDAKRVGAEAKRVAAEAKRVANDAQHARRNADRAATDATRAERRAADARNDAALGSRPGAMTPHRR